MKDFKGKLALLLLALLSVHLIALKGQAQALDDFDTKANSRFSKEFCVTDPHLGNTLQSALAYLGSRVCKLHYRAPEAINANLSIPANITLAPDAGAVLTVAPGVTLTINGGLDAKPYQIFSCTPGQVQFGATSPVADFYPEWFGAAGDGVTDDLNALNCCREAMVNIGGTRVGRGMMHLGRWYAVSSTFSVDDITLNNYGTFIIQGAGKKTSGFIGTTACDNKPVMEIVGTPNVQLYNLGIAGITTNTYSTVPSQAPSVALLLSRSTSNPNGYFSQFSYLEMSGFFRYGTIYNYGYSNSVFDGITASCSPINSNQWLFDIAFINPTYSNILSGIAATNSTMSKVIAGAEGCEMHMCDISSMINTSYKVAGNAWLYCVGVSPYLYNSGADSNSDYYIYALDTGINAENLGGDGGGNVAGIYLASDSHASGWPSACAASVYLINCINNVAGNVPALIADAHTQLSNSIINGLRGSNGFKIQLGKGASRCQFINNFTLTSFVSSAGSFSHNYLEIPNYTCKELNIYAGGATYDNIIRDNRGFDTGNYCTWLGGQSTDVGIGNAALPINALPNLLIGPYKMTWASAAPTAGDWMQGSVVWNQGAAAGGSPGWVCTSSGTFGTLNGGKTTGSIMTGTNALMVNTTTGLGIGNFLDVAGAANADQIVNIDLTTKVVTLRNNATATVTGAAVSFHNNPVFKAMANLAS